MKKDDTSAASFSFLIPSSPVVFTRQVECPFDDPSVGCVDVPRLIVLGLVLYELVLFSPSRASFRSSIIWSLKL